MTPPGQLYVAGAWSAPSTERTIDVISPHTEEVVATVPAAGPGDVDRAVAAARLAFDEGPWPRLDPSERVDAVRRLSALYAGRRGEMAELITAEMGAPDLVLPLRPGHLAHDAPQHLRRHRLGLRVGGHPSGRLRRGHHPPQRAGRRGGGDRPLEHAPVPHRREAGTRPAGRLPHHHQARARDAARRPPAGRAGRRARVCPTDWSASSPVAGRSGSCWSATPGWTRWPSPARRRLAARWPRPAAPPSPGSASSWAASRPPSCWTTPTRPRWPRGCGWPA